MSQGRGFHGARPVSFLNCELKMSSVVRYSGSSTTVVTMSHVPPSAGSANVLKNSLTVARSLYGTPLARR